MKTQNQETKLLQIFIKNLVEELDSHITRFEPIQKEDVFTRGYVLGVKQCSKLITDTTKELIEKLNKKENLYNGKN